MQLLLKVPGAETSIKDFKSHTEMQLETTTQLRSAINNSSFNSPDNLLQQSKVGGEWMSTLMGVGAVRVGSRMGGATGLQLALFLLTHFSCVQHCVSP